MLIRDNLTRRHLAGRHGITSDGVTQWTCLLRLPNALRVLLDRNYPYYLGEFAVYVVFGEALGWPITPDAARPALRCTGICSFAGRIAGPDFTRSLTENTTSALDTTRTAAKRADYRQIALLFFSNRHAFHLV
ncbi:hypothetical protein DRQ21_03825, partial [Candidatus Fermentibacteria bacterium]